ncbi:MAG: RNA-binding S4 domain-containing protein [Lachnospiraceae bacterium]|jgi:ribosomal 50S subunit-recycling heat shock protein|nr:RNA-binding S4 domain-containing protein [Lachnospiraceae bacterium]
MRLDKYLKVSRLIKRRTVACDACNAGRVSVNGKAQKASYDVKIGDRISIIFGEKAVEVEVLSLEETQKKDEAKEMYKYV